MYVLAIQHRVQDYDAWKKVFDAYPPEKAGARFHRVNRAVGDANLVTVVAGWPTAAGAEAFKTNPEIGAAMKQAGVVNAPRFELYEEVEAVQA